MGKFFAVVGYLTSVLAAAFGLVWLFNKYNECLVDEEIECECECGDECEGSACTCGCSCADKETSEEA